MPQYNAYDFQYAPPPPNFSINMNCPAPPGMSEWNAQAHVAMPMQQHLEEEEKLKREGKRCILK
jgi:hypothetical protein